MRLVIATTSLAILLGSLVNLSGMALAAEGDIWAVNRTNINVRSGPSTTTDVLATVNPGDKIVEIAAKGEWFYAEFPDHNMRGWIFGPLLVKSDSTETVGTATAAPSAAPANGVEVTAQEVPTPSAKVVVPVTPAAVPTAAPAQEVQTNATAASSLPSATQKAAPEPAAAATAVVATGSEPAAVKTFRETVAELNERAVSVAGINLFNDVRSAGGGAVQVLATETWASVPEAGQSSYMNALFDRWQSMAGGLGPLSLQIIDPNGQVMMERSGS